MGAKPTYADIQTGAIEYFHITICENSTCRSRMHAHVRERKVCKWHPKNSMRATFDLLHEIGHIETTKPYMRRCESEYHATQWAIDRLAELGVKVPSEIIKLYQDYIYREHDRGTRRHCTTLPPKHLLKLNA